ncbi:HAD-IIIA family hydrolase [Candidatus Parcubacteria bacterium]|nr:MAG: HAD-IIIA family hydrolase [Candidatus Parcubacteria bacterium]
MRDKCRKRAVFIDRDGVINKLVHRPGIDVCGRRICYSAPWSYRELEIYQETKSSLDALGRLNLLKFLVTNQPDIGYGLLPREEHNKIMADIFALGFDDIFICFHGRHENCNCKKPKPGMLIEAARKWNIDLGNSYMVGDSVSDMEAGKSVGCKTLLVSDSLKTICNKYDFVAKNILEVARIIEKNERRKRNDGNFY